MLHSVFHNRLDRQRRQQKITDIQLIIKTELPGRIRLLQCDILADMAHFRIKRNQSLRSQCIHIAAKITGQVFHAFRSSLRICLTERFNGRERIKDEMRLHLYRQLGSLRQPEMLFCFRQALLTIDHDQGMVQVQCNRPGERDQVKFRQEE